MDVLIVSIFVSLFVIRLSVQVLLILDSLVGSTLLIFSTELVKVSIFGFKGKLDLFLIVLILTSPT